MSTSRRLFGYLFSLVIIAGLLGALWQRQAIIDWWRLRGYTPAPAIAALADNTAMTSDARRYFFVNHPELTADKGAFRAQCPLREQTIVLGCYIGGQRGIFIYDVTDPQLDGIEQVTAAHEMLHAAYERLGAGEREDIERQLSEYYANGLTDERVKETINSYRESEPNDLLNEMHSIFGTEIRDLPAGLESYYKQYFSDRSRVVGYAEAYEAVFAANQAKLDEIKTQIDRLKSELDRDQAAIDTEQSSLEAEKARMDSLRDQGRIEEFNSAVGPYNARVSSLRSKVAAYNAKVERVNDLIDEYNGLAVSQENLIKAIDNRL